MNRVFIVGCGDIGRRVAGIWREEGVPVSALARSQESARRLQSLGIAVFHGDLDDPPTLSGLPTKDALVHYLAPPPGEGEDDPRMRAFIGGIPPGEEPARIVYVSTTGVYGDLRGGWATEETPAAPSTGRGKRRLAAERTLFSFAGERGVHAVVLRVAGIYGPGRLPAGKVRAGAPVPVEAEAPWSNRIHAEDLARVCAAAARRGRDGAVYNVSDGRPGTITQYYNAVADLLGAPRPPAVTMDEARRVLGETMLSYLSESKRIDNRKMLEELGIRLLYPDLEEGLKACTGGEE